MTKRLIHRKLRRLKSELKSVVHYNFMKRHRIKKEIEQLQNLLKERIWKMRNKFYLHEFKLFDGEEYITFNIVALNESKKEILVAVTNRGRITQVTYDLFEDENGYYFEYGCDYTKVKIEDFKEVKDEYWKQTRMGLLRASGRSKRPYWRKT